MQDDILRTVQTLLQNDRTVSEEQRRRILAACRDSAGREVRRLCTVGEAARILQCHPKSCYRLRDRGFLHTIHHSKRKVRFDLDEVQRFAANGMEHVRDGE